MTVFPPSDKVKTVIDPASALLWADQFSIQDLAHGVGLFASMFPVCPLGKAHYRSLKCIKIQCLKNSAGNFDSQVYLFRFHY